LTIPQNNIQSLFLDRVRSRLPDNVSFADELGDLLNISRDSAYRRIRGETILSLEEVKALYLRFGISVDELFSTDSEMVTFHRRVVTPENYDLSKWQHSILKNLQYLCTFNKKEMIFSAKDIPVFHYFRLPELSAFKHFFWMKTLVGYPEFEKLKFKFAAVPEKLLATAEIAYTTYATIPSTEIWNEEAIYDTLRQIEFYYECGFFDNPSHAGFLCDQLTTLLNVVQEEAAAGVKSKGGAFSLYNNEILIADNTVFARMDEKRCVYVNQSTLNILLTFQEPFCKQTELYLKNLIKKSTLISGTAERERNRFFNNMRNRIAAFKSRFN
jgi:hypothetical protein